MFDLFQEVSQTLRRNKMRTALTGIAVAWGVFMLIVLLGASRGTLNASVNTMDADRYQSLTIWSGWTTKPYKGFKDQRSVTLRDRDLAALEAHGGQHVNYAVGTISIDTAKIKSDTEYISGGVQGIFPEMLKLQGHKMEYGRFINGADIKERRKSLVLSKENADILFGSADKAVGRTVNSMNLAWTVVGVYSSRWERATMAPYSTISALKGGSLEPDNIQVILKDIDNEQQASDAEKDTRRTMAAEHAFDPDDEGAIYVWNRMEDYLRNRSLSGIFTGAVWIIGLLTLLTGIVGVSNIQFVSVKERTHEIGLRRAIGARSRQILVQMVLESVCITALFGYIGIFLGVAVTQLMDVMFSGNDFMKNPTVDLSVAIEVTVVLIIVGALAGIFPALKATKVSPVEALRDE